MGFSVAGIGAVGTWWSGLNGEMVSLQGRLIRCSWDRCCWNMVERP